MLQQELLWLVSNLLLVHKKMLISLNGIRKSNDTLINYHFASRYSVQYKICLNSLLLGFVRHTCIIHFERSYVQGIESYSVTQ